MATARSTRVAKLESAIHRSSCTDTVTPTLVKQQILQVVSPRQMRERQPLSCQPCRTTSGIGEEREQPCSTCHDEARERRCQRIPGIGIRKSPVQHRGLDRCQVTEDLCELAFLAIVPGLMGLAEVQRLEDDGEELLHRERRSGGIRERGRGSRLPDRLRRGRCARSLWPRWGEVGKAMARCSRVLDRRHAARIDRRSSRLRNN